MPAPASSVLQRLRALGLTQGMVATYLGASQSAVSLWETGKRPFEEPWQTEALVLLAVLEEHLAHGGTLATFRHEPGLDLVSGTPHRVGMLRIPAAKALEYHKLQDELRSQPAARQAPTSWRWMAQMAIEELATWVANVEPRTWQPTARELDAMRRRVEGLYGLLTSLLITPPQEDPHADETP